MKNDLEQHQLAIHCSEVKKQLLISRRIKCGIPADALRHAGNFGVFWIGVRDRSHTITKAPLVKPDY